MRQAIFYKEWIKTRWYFFLATLISWGFVSYSLLKINRVINFKGAGHLWEVMLERDVVFIDLLTYLPLIIGTLFAIVQFVPETQQSRLKLTLHLPCQHYQMIFRMLLFGILLLTGCFISNYIILSAYLEQIMTTELLRRILLTALPWYIAGITSYLLTAWICLEPTWKRRIVDILVTAGVLRIFFLSSVPEAYNRFLPILIVYKLLICLLPMLSVYRFKTGKQD